MGTHVRQPDSNLRRGYRDVYVIGLPQRKGDSMTELGRHMVEAHDTPSELAEMLGDDGLAILHDGAHGNYVSPDDASPEHIRTGKGE